MEAAVPGDGEERSVAIVTQGRRRLDLLAVPGLRRVLLWKHNRTALQLLLLVVALIMVLDGWLGSHLAARNTATVAAWVHYRGLIVLALLLVGNLFCAACPFLLPRALARRLGRPTRRWPRVLRNKWLALAALIGLLFVYELYDLWASPWLTAWLIVAYFAAAFVLEAFFTRDAFCLYVCPLGSFNFLYSTVSPLQITTRNQAVCRDCVGKECINGRWSADDRLVQQGCQLELYVPTLNSNLNCTLCLDCAKACPHENVALVTRPPGDELFRRTWPNRLDLAFLAILAAWLGLVNAFAMTPPAYTLLGWLSDLLNTRNEAIVLGLVFAVGVILGPTALVYGAAWLNRRTDARPLPLHRYLLRHAYSFVPLGFAVWTAHYLFHLLIGPLTIWPAFQTFWVQVTGVALFGRPDWALAAAWVVPLEVIRVLQVAIMVVGLVTALMLSWRAAESGHPDRTAAWREFWPWAAVLLLLAVAATWVFLLPMEMRGNILG